MLPAKRIIVTPLMSHVCAPTSSPKSVNENAIILVHDWSEVACTYMYIYMCVCIGVITLVPTVYVVLWFLWNIC